MSGDLDNDPGCNLTQRTPVFVDSPTIRASAQISRSAHWGFGASEFGWPLFGSGHPNSSLSKGLHVHPAAFGLGDRSFVERTWMWAMRGIYIQRKTTKAQYTKASYNLLEIRLLLQYSLNYDF